MVTVHMHKDWDQEKLCYVPYTARCDDIGLPSGNFMLAIESGGEAVNLYAMPDELLSLLDEAKRAVLAAMGE